MTRGMLARVSTLLLLALSASSAIAHHSDAGIDVHNSVRLEGTITEFVWRNPHVYFKVEATTFSGKTGEWNIQMASIPPLSRAGWTRDSLKPGDEVVVRSHPALDGRQYGVLVTIEKDGVVMSTRQAAAVETVPADTLEGVWRGDRSTIGDFTLFFDRLVPNQEGAAAREAFNALTEENPMSTCLGRPTPATLASAGGYLSEIRFVGDTIVFHNEIFDAMKVVYMDGRGHPENGERALYGHSIGWWEGGTLVVDAVNFADHRSPYQNGIPSGAQKHVVEKYRLAEGGRRIIVELFMEDPEYLAEPLTDTMEWIYSPDWQMVPWQCNEDSTRTFLRTSLHTQTARPLRPAEIASTSRMSLVR